MPLLAGQLAVVTGASSGLGRATAVRLAELGARVALLARAAADLDEVAAGIAECGGAAYPMATDLADVTAVAATIERVSAAGEPVRVLVNAAATDAPGPAETVSLEDWERVVRVNLTAPFLLSRALLPQMRAAGGGTIVNVSSVAGRRGWANAAAYCATKFALTGLTQALAAEGSEYGVRVVCLYPGAMATQWGVWDPAQRGNVEQQAASAEALPAADVAEFIAWLVQAPAHLVVTDAVVAPLHERGWPWLRLGSAAAVNGGWRLGKCPARRRR
jgi:NADP-dependent 3-hydroxy acid dehydrogenase YdfG